MIVRNSLTTKVLSCGVPVIDVSRWQKSVDFGKARDAGVRGVYHKATQGTRYSKSGLYVERGADARKAGLPFGGYHYTKCTVPQDEAIYFSGVLDRVQGELPPMLDFEERDIIRDLGPAQSADWINRFTVQMKREGHERVVLYTYPAVFRMIDATAIDWTGVDLWMAYYGSGTDEAACRRLLTKYGGDVRAALEKRYPIATAAPDPVMWQWTSSGKMPGVSGRCDINAASETWFNAQLTPDAPPAPPEAYDVIQGTPVSHGKSASSLSTLVSEIDAVLQRYR